MLNGRWNTALLLLVSAAPVVCFAQMPPSNSGDYAATVTSVAGAVSVLRDNDAWALDVGDLVQVKQIIVSGPDGHATFQVSDGSTFEVFPNSHVVFRKNPPNWRDLIDVLVGRVKVHIQKWGNQPNPNRIHTPTAVISVRGTTFDVAVNEDDESTVIEVEEGVVEVRHALLPGGNPRVVNAGESLTVYKSQPLARSSIDRGRIAQHILRALQDALYTAVYRNPRTGIPGAGGAAGRRNSGRRHYGRHDGSDPTTCSSRDLGRGHGSAAASGANAVAKLSLQRLVGRAASGCGLRQQIARNRTLPSTRVPSR